MSALLILLSTFAVNFANANTNANNSTGTRGGASVGSSTNASSLALVLEAKTVKTSEPASGPALNWSQVTRIE